MKPATHPSLYALRPVLYASALLALTALLAASAVAADTPDPRKGPYKDLFKGEFVHQDKPLAKDGLPFWLFAERKFTTGSKRYPLVVVLHGRRNNVKPGTKFTPQAIATPWTSRDVQRKNPCYVIQPYYPPQSGWEKIPEKLDATLVHLFKNLPIDRQRVYIFGFSNGGQGTFQALARRPNWFAGAVTVSGPVSPMSVVGKFKTPVWMWVGENDNDLNKRKRVEELAEALDDAGVEVKLDIVKGAGHSCHAKATQNEDVHEWLFSRKLKP